MCARALDLAILRGEGERAAEWGRWMSRPLVGRPGRAADRRVAPTGPPLFSSAGIMARGCTKVATSSIDASVAGVEVLIAGRVTGVMAGVVATVLDSPLLAMG